MPYSRTAGLECSMPLPWLRTATHSSPSILLVIFLDMLPWSPWCTSSIETETRDPNTTPLMLNVSLNTRGIRCSRYPASYTCMYLSLSAVIALTWLCAGRFEPMPLHRALDRQGGDDVPVFSAKFRNDSSCPNRPSINMGAITISLRQGDNYLLSHKMFASPLLCM